MAEYGIPYMGSKSSICNKLIKVFPKADNFYDLFGGGFSITHAMLVRRSKEYKHFHFNELRIGICELIKKAINGDFNYKVFKPKFISRENFLANINDAYTKIIWSFGNNGKNYLFSKEIEPYKRSMHNAIVFNDFDDLAKKVLGMKEFKEGFSITDKRLFLRNKIERFRMTKIPDFLLPFIKEEQLQQLQQLEQLSLYNTSYEKVPIKENSTIYCDILYEGTADYGNSFNRERFLDWAAYQKQPVFISEYNISDNRFYRIGQMAKRSLLTIKTGNDKKEENIYTNQTGRTAIYNQKVESLNGQA